MPCLLRSRQLSVPIPCAVDGSVVEPDDDAEFLLSGVLDMFAGDGSAESRCVGVELRPARVEAQPWSSRESTRCSLCSGREVELDACILVPSTVLSLISEALGWSAACEAELGVTLHVVGLALLSRSAGPMGAEIGATGVISDDFIPESTSYGRNSTLDALIQELDAELQSTRGESWIAALPHLEGADGSKSGLLADQLLLDAGGRWSKSSDEHGLALEVVSPTSLSGTRFALRPRTYDPPAGDEMPPPPALIPLACAAHVSTVRVGTQDRLARAAGRGAAAAVRGCFELVSSVPANLCILPLSAPPSWDGHLVLVEDGHCPLWTKALRAQHIGVPAVLVARAAAHAGGAGNAPTASMTGAAQQSQPLVELDSRLREVVRLEWGASRPSVPFLEGAEPDVVLARAAIASGVVVAACMVAVGP